jgi:hypothetical protein
MSSIIRVDQIQTAAGGTPTAADLGINTTGSVIQVVNTLLDGAPAGNSTSFTAISGYSASITPTSADNKIFAVFTAHCGGQAGYIYQWRLKRSTDGVTFTIPFTNSSNAGAQDGVIFGFYSHSGSEPATENYVGDQKSFSFLDSPNTTNEVTYQVYAKTSGVGYWRMNHGDALNDSSRYTSRSSITLMEIAG